MPKKSNKIQQPPLQENNTLLTDFLLNDKLSEKERILITLQIIEQVKKLHTEGKYPTITLKNISFNPKTLEARLDVNENAPASRQKESIDSLIKTLFNPSAASLANTNEASTIFPKYKFPVTISVNASGTSKYLEGAGSRYAEMLYESTTNYDARTERWSPQWKVSESIKTCDDLALAVIEAGFRDRHFACFNTNPPVVKKDEIKENDKPGFIKAVLCKLKTKVSSNGYLMDTDIRLMLPQRSALPFFFTQKAAEHTYECKEILELLEIIKNKYVNSGNTNKKKLTEIERVINIFKVKKPTEQQAMIHALNSVSGLGVGRLNAGLQTLAKAVKTGTLVTPGKIEEKMDKHAPEVSLIKRIFR